MLHHVGKANAAATERETNAAARDGGGHAADLSSDGHGWIEEVMLQENGRMEHVDGGCSVEIREDGLRNEWRGGRMNRLIDGRIR